jgi:hypothetical protein
VLSWNQQALPQKAVPFPLDIPSTAGFAKSGFFRALHPDLSSGLRKLGKESTVGGVNDCQKSFFANLTQKSLQKADKSVDRRTCKKERSPI